MGVGLDMLAVQVPEAPPGDSVAVNLFGRRSAMPDFDGGLAPRSGEDQTPLPYAGMPDCGPGGDRADSASRHFPCVRKIRSRRLPHPTHKIREASCWERVGSDW